ncbi:DUF4153 domain-containing protein [Virgibacillus byunsanensis]|uniref:DUF4153 domain-containing protein n=1 Tax=Virgibacillus byunsanensis TaxID=570945 RepID=A0ABW3LIJ0_9BACI
MDLYVKQKDWLFLLVCFGLGILAEISFFHGSIGLSYPVFIAGFYMVLFLRYRLSFTHRRIGLLIMVVIWLLAGSYLFYDSILLHNLNLLIIPVLVFIHMVLITSPNNWSWAAPEFLTLLITKFNEGLKYSSAFCNAGFKRIFKNMNEQTAQIVKRIFLGLVIGIPLLLVITGLLMSADAVFQDIVLRLPQFIFQFNFQEGLFRFVLIIMFTLLFFGIFQVLHVKSKQKESYTNKEKSRVSWDGITTATVLVLLNGVYVVFTVIQFRYFFSDSLQNGFTYAEYARRGFFELVIVTLINWTVLTTFLNLVKNPGKRMNLMMKIMYSLLIVVSGVMLTSAFQRLSMYEAAYGFTLDRILAHAFMIFLMVVFAYTLIRVWMERLSLLHFYLIAGLIFYTGLHVIHIEQIIVDENLDRYERTGKIDIHYLNSLSYTGVNGLIKLYQEDPDHPRLQGILQNEKQIAEQSPSTWQSFNFIKQKVTKKLRELDL